MDASCYFDTESLVEITDEIESITKNPQLQPSQKADMVGTIIENLEPEKKREYFEYMNYVKTSQTKKSDKFVGVPSQQNKFAIIELDNMQFHYCLNFGMIANIMYLQTRLAGYNAEDREAVERFLKFAYGNHDDKYIGTIYDMYYKNNKAKYPTEIPTIDKDVLGDAMPTPEQVKNVLDFATNKYEEVRCITTALTGYKPSQEGLIRVHGVVDNDKLAVTDHLSSSFLELDRNGSVYVLPVGKVRLIDPFKEFRTGVNIFNPNETDVSILGANNLALNASQSKKFKERLANLPGKLTAEQASSLKDYSSQLKQLESLPEKTPENRQEIELVKREIKTIQEIAAQDGEVITKVIKMDRRKKKVSVKDKVAKVEGELDIF